jgi:predicted transcriptional regulator
MNPKYKRYKICDEKRLNIYNILVHEVKTQMELSRMTGESPSAIKWHVRYLMDNRHVQAIRLKQTGKLKFYRATDLKYIPRTDAQIEKELVKRMTSISDIYHNKIRDVPLTNGRIIRNLDRPGSDYAWQRPKRKAIGASIGSSFSLYDGFA